MMETSAALANVSRFCWGLWALPVGVCCILVKLLVYVSSYDVSASTGTLLIIFLAASANVKQPSPEKVKRWNSSSLLCEISQFTHIVVDKLFLTLQQRKPDKSYQNLQILSGEGVEIQQLAVLETP
jgi:hypothetical protein